MGGLPFTPEVIEERLSGELVKRGGISLWGWGRWIRSTGTLAGPVVEDPRDNGGGRDHRDDLHLLAAGRTQERVDLPDEGDESGPRGGPRGLLGAGGWIRGRTQGWRKWIGRFRSPGLRESSEAVGVDTRVGDEPIVGVRNMLTEDRQEFLRLEGAEVAPMVRVELVILKENFSVKSEFEAFEGDAGPHEVLCPFGRPA